MWNQMKNLKKFDRLKRVDNVWSSEENEEYLRFITNQNHSSVSTIDRPDYNDDIVEVKFLYNEFLEFLKTRDPDSARGTDSISYRMILNLTEQSKLKLFDVMSDIWKSGLIPTVWRKIKIHPIPKKVDTTEITNYRPICLLSVLLKCVEGMLKPRLEDHVKTNDLLPQRSFAFRKNMGTNQCINDLLNMIAFLQKKI